MIFHCNAELPIVQERRMWYTKIPHAGMMELVDMRDLGTCTSNGMNTISNVPQTIEMTDFSRFLL